jgi:hypothetical protein
MILAATDTRMAKTPVHWRDACSLWGWDASVQAGIGWVLLILDLSREQIGLVVVVPENDILR